MRLIQAKYEEEQEILGEQEEVIREEIEGVAKAKRDDEIEMEDIEEADQSSKIFQGLATEAKAAKDEELAREMDSKASLGGDESAVGLGGEETTTSLGGEEAAMSRKLHLPQHRSKLAGSLCMKAGKQGGLPRRR